MKSKKKVKYKVVDTSQKYFNEYYKYLEHLFLRAKQENGLLRRFVKNAEKPERKNKETN